MTGRARSARRQGPADHLTHVADQIGQIEQSLQGAAGVLLAMGVELPPAVEAARQTGSHLRIFLLQQGDFSARKT